jgi:hypothetical protein
MTRTTGTYSISTTLGESVRAFVPHALPPSDPALSPEVFTDLNRQAELALARLAGVSGLVPSVDWLLYSAIRKEALLTSQIEGTQATLTDLFDDEAGFKVSNTDDVEEVTNYLRAFRWTQEQLRDPKGLPISVHLLCEAHRRLLTVPVVQASNRVSCVGRRTGSVAHGPATRFSYHHRRSMFPRCWPIWSGSFTIRLDICRRWSRWRSSMRSLKPSTPFSTATDA